MEENLDITKIRLSIADLAHDVETIIRLNPKFLLSTDLTKKDVIKAFTEQMEKTINYINLYVNQECDQYLLYLAIRLLELRRIIKDEDSWCKSYKN